MHIDLLTAEDEIRLARAIEAGVVAEQLLACHQVGAMTRPVSATTAELRQVVDVGRVAWRTMWMANLRLTWSMAARHHRRFGGDLDDLAQEAQLGLAEALQRWDHTRGSRFSTCAWTWIKARISLAQRRQLRHHEELSSTGELPELADSGADQTPHRWIEALPSDWLLRLDAIDRRLLHERFGTDAGARPSGPLLAGEVTRRRMEKAALERARQAWQAAG